MRVWKVVVLLNLALVLGAGWGWAWWGRRAAALGTDLATARAHAARLERELAAARGSGATPGDQQWEARGVVRAIMPEINILVLTHEDIPGYMPSMTMGFRAASPTIHESVQVGDEVRFVLRGTPPNVAVTAIEKIR